MDIYMTSDEELIINCENSVDEYALHKWLNKGESLAFNVANSTQHNRLCIIIAHKEQSDDNPK